MKNNSIRIFLLFGSLFLANPCFSQFSAPTKPRTSEGSNEEQYFSHFKDHFQNRKSIPPEKVKVIAQQSKSLTKSGCQYSSNSQLAILNTAQLISFLKSTSNYECHARLLFQYEEDYSPLIFTNEKIQAIANEIQNIAAGYDGTFSNGLYGLICYIHVAEYFDWYYHSTITLDQTSLNAIKNAINALSNNSHLFDLNSEASSILDEFLIILDLTGVRALPATIGLMKQIMKNMTTTDIWKTVADIDWVTCYWRIFSLMFRGVNNGDTDFISSISNDNEFISLLGSVATDSEIANNSDINYIWQENAVLILSISATNSSLTNLVCPYLATVAGMFPRLNKNWLNAVIALNDAGKCSEYNVCEDKAALKAEVSDMLFPNIYLYNDGNLVFNAKFSKDISDNLYYATRQTEAQLFRLAQIDQPIIDDINTKLTAVVFDSKESYDNYAPFLYGIATDNGGMYIEERSEFYTWDRPATYYLSLEELFRHEFNHYLQERYLVPGYWGQCPFYDYNRLTWYEEGHAEFLSASTDNEGIKLRRATIERVKSDYPDWPTLTDVFNSYYGEPGAIYYPYGNLIWYNWYNNDYEKIKTFNDLTRNNDIVGFDNLVNSLKNNSIVEAQWKSFLTDVYNGLFPAWEVKTDWVNDSLLTVATINDIQNEFTAITGIHDVTVTLDATSLIRRFRISGTLNSNGPVSNNTDAAKSLNKALDFLLTQLKNDQYICNFDYSVGYLTNISFQGNIPRANFIILGSLRSESIGDTPKADFTSNINIATTSTPINFASLSSGYLKGYLWSFPGGTPPNSIVAAPIVSYDTAGTFLVSLTALGKTTSFSDTKTVGNYIKIYEKSSQSYCLASHVYDYSWISHVKLKDIDNSTLGFPQNGYSDFTSSYMTELVKDSIYPISIDLNYTNSPSITISLWIDLNHNGSFQDTGEQLLLAKPNVLSQLSGATIKIPVNSTNGITRMRIRATYNGAIISPCGVDTYMGEIEDYSVVIINSSSNEPPTVPSGLTASEITQTSFSLNWNPSIANVGLNGYNIYLNGTFIGFETTSSYNVTGLTAGKTYSVTIKAVDELRQTSMESSSLSVSTLFPLSLLVSNDSLTISSKGNSTQTFDIISNTSWTVACNQSWLTVGNSYGSDNAIITLTATSNLYTTERIAIVTISGTGVSTQNIVVIQDPGTTGINDIFKNNFCTIFPNPNNGKFLIQLENEFIGEFTVTILNEIGNYFQIAKITKSSYKITYEITMEKMSKGLYFVRIQIKDSIITKIVIVQ